MNASITYLNVTEVIIRYNFPWPLFLFISNSLTRKIHLFVLHTKAMSSGKDPKFVDQGSTASGTRMIMQDEHIPGNVASAATPNYSGVRI